MIKALERVDWKVFAVLLAAGLLGALAVLPYMADLIGTLPVDRASGPALSLPALVALALLQNGILLSAIIITGLILSERIGPRMPLIRGWATGAPPANVKAIALPGILVGAAGGAVLVEDSGGKTHTDGHPEMTLRTCGGSPVLVSMRHASTASIPRLPTHADRSQRSLPVRKRQDVQEMSRRLGERCRRIARGRGRARAQGGGCGGR